MKLSVLGQINLDQKFKVTLSYQSRQKSVGLHEVLVVGIIIVALVIYLFICLKNHFLFVGATYFICFVKNKILNCEKFMIKQLPSETCFFAKLLLYFHLDIVPYPSQCFRNTILLNNS